MTTSENVPRWKRYLSPRFLVSKVREKGVVWCAHTIWQRVWSRLYRRTRPIRANLWSAYDNIRYSGKKQPDVLYAFYDLAVSPATFDIVSFIVLAELERKEIGCSSLHIVIVPGSAEGFRVGDLETYRRTGAQHYDTEHMRWRLRNVLVPCCWLIPSCQQVTVCTSREEAQSFQASLVKYMFPKGYTVRFPKAHYLLGRIVAAASQGVVLPSIRTSPQARRFVSDWIQLKTAGRKVIAISLRECAYQQDRNSNLEAWGAFARSLNPSIYCPVVIRDTEAAFEPSPSELDGLTVFSEASWNIGLRAALYELSYLNMSVSNGPVVLCLFNRRARCLVFKLLTPSADATTEQFFRSQGFEPGSQFKHATPFQRLVWQDDRLEVIQEAFREMCDTIEAFSKEHEEQWPTTFNLPPT